MSRAPFSSCALLVLALAAPSFAQECSTFPLVEGFGAGTPGSAGVPALKPFGQPMVDQPGMGLAITAGAPGAPAQIIVGSPAGPQFLPAYGARLYPGSPFTRFPVTIGPDGSSPAVHSGPAATSPALCGLELVAQGLVFDPVAQGGLAFTGGVRLCFGVGSAAASLFDGACFYTSPTQLAISSAIAAGDVNGDGRSDVVVAGKASSQEGTLRVLFHLADGSLWGASEVPSGSGDEGARQLVVTDLDGDDLLDAAILFGDSGPSGGLSLLRGHGDGTFDDPVVLAALPDGELTAVAAADLDGDGLLELVIAGWGDDSVGILPNLGGMSFGAAVELPLGAAPLAHVPLRLADATGDGMLDIVLPRNTPGLTKDFVIFPGLGGVSFGAAQDIDTVFTHIENLAVGDVDGDSDLDIVLCATNTSSLPIVGGLWLFGNEGSGQFSPATDADGMADWIPAFGVELADLDHDGLPELLRSGDGVHVQLNSGGSFGPSLEVKVVHDSLVVHDMDGDGQADLLMGSVSSVRWIRGLGGASFDFPSDPYAATSFPYQAQWVVAADLDADGLSDLAFAPPSGSDWFGVRIAAGGGTFGPLVEYPGGGTDFPMEPAIVDIDGDGDLDALVTSAAPGVVSVLRGSGDGTFGPPESYATPMVSSGPLVADLDSDGDLDVVARIGFTSGAISVLLGNGDGTLVPGQTVGSGMGRLIGLGDVDEDGLPDLVCSTVAGNIQFLPGQGDGTFSTPVIITTGAPLARGHLADLDQDGHLDLVLSQSFQALRVYLGAGDGTFALSHSAIAPFGGSIAAADLNGDGALDLIGSSTNSTLNALLLGFGDGTFAPVQPGGAGGAVGDFDGDGDLDTAARGLVFLNQLH